jgi:hypothetical protein
MVGLGAVACAGAALLLMGNKNIPLYERADAAREACTDAGAELAALWGASKRLADDCFAPRVTRVVGQPGKLIVTRTVKDTHNESSTYSVMTDGRGTDRWRVVDVRRAPSNLSLDASLLATQQPRALQ